jgi:1,4-alpha-glucan branching enzyme
LQWDLLKFPGHGGMKYCIKKLNELYVNEPALYEKQFDTTGFEWIDLNHRDEAVIAYMRKGENPEENVLVLLNFQPVVHWNWTIQVFGKKDWKEIFNSDSKDYWGTGNMYNPEIKTELIDEETQQYELTVHLPALAGIVLK